MSHNIRYCTSCKTLILHQSWVVLIVRTFTICAFHCLATDSNKIQLSEGKRTS